MQRTILLLTALFAAIASVEAGVKCGDIISVRGVGNGRFWQTHRGLTQAIATGVSDKRAMYTLRCKYKSDRDPIQFGDVVYIMNVASGEIIADGGKADHEASSHNHIVQELSTMNKTATPSPLNEFTLFKPGTIKDLNSRGPITNGMKVAIRNRYTRFLTSTRANNRILSKQYGSAALTDLASFILDGFCPSIGEGKPCDGRGKCVDNRCECDHNRKGPVCEVSRHAAFCHAIAQSHWKSFDNLFFNTHTSGEYLMYSSPEAEDKEAVTVTLGNVPGEPQNAAPVPIAVSFRKGGDIVTVSTEGKVSINCGGDDQLAVRATKGAGFRTDAGINIRFVDHDRIDVRSPSGVKIVISSLPKALNVYLHIFEPRLGELKGLCGNFDGNGKNDMTVATNKDADKAKVATFAIPAARSLRKCAKESNVAFIEVAPAFVGMDAFIGDGGRVTQLIASMSKVEKDISSPMDRAKMSLHSALHDSCSGSSSKNLMQAKAACTKLSVSDTAAGLEDYATCLSDICLTGDKTYAHADIDAADMDAVEAKDNFDGDLEDDEFEF